MNRRASDEASDEGVGAMMQVKACMVDGANGYVAKKG
jgi:hypothetical protein